ncbi:MAG: IscS subfamily cysteine desulfurase [Rickettsiaceae bacterium H1]|nr:IscS subfamily cysteine desulfurase [Rickettsiaceae bacterium H1]
MATKESLTFPIFLDYQSTTRTDPRVLDEMMPYFSEFSNPHSRSHSFGWNAEEVVENARREIAKVINANSKDIIFTSGATESNNLAIKGCMEFYRKSKDHIITVATEHKCVLDSCRHLEEKGFKVTYLPVSSNGIIDLDELEDTITEKTNLVSVMAVNNEIGVIQPLKEVGEICQKYGVFFHTDAAQGYGKIPIDVDEMNISLLSISGHKIYAPMGVGALYVRRRPRVRIQPLINGGGQERGMRSGTVPTALAVGLGKAAEICFSEMEEEKARLTEMKDFFLMKIKKGVGDILVNGDLKQRWPGNLNISFPYVEGESIIMAIKQLAVSSGSACTSASLEPSYVLRSLGVDEDLAHSSIRFGFGRFTTKEEVIFASELISSKIRKLRDMSPLWEMVQEGVDLKSIKWNDH